MSYTNILTGFGRDLKGSQLRAIRHEFALDLEPFADLVGLHPRTLEALEYFDNQMTPGPASRLIWLLAVDEYQRRYPSGDQMADIWSLVEAAARQQITGSRTRAPKLHRGLSWWSSPRYVAALHYRDPYHVPEFFFATNNTLSQRALSRLVDVTAPTVHGWAHQKSLPRRSASKLLFLIAAAPILFEEQTSVFNVLEWTRRNTQTQPHYFHHYLTDPLDTPVCAWPPRPRSTTNAPLDTPAPPY